MLWHNTVIFGILNFFYYVSKPFWSASPEPKTKLMINLWEPINGTFVLWPSIWNLYMSPVLIMLSGLLFFVIYNQFNHKNNKEFGLGLFFLSGLSLGFMLGLFSVDTSFLKEFLILFLACGLLRGLTKKSQHKGIIIFVFGVYYATGFFFGWGASIGISASVGIAFVASLTCGILGVIFFTISFFLGGILNFVFGEIVSKKFWEKASKFIAGK